MSVPACLSLPDVRWIERAVAFNLAPASYVHDSWLEALPNGDLAGTLKRQPAALASISRFLLDTMHLQQAYFHDFAEPRSRLALLDGTTLENVFLYAGLALRRDELRGEIDGTRLGHVRKMLGSSALEFAVRRTAFLGKLPRFDYEPQTPDLRIRLMLIGAVYALSPTLGSNPAYAQRVLLKLPHELSDDLLSAWAEQQGVEQGPELPGLVKRLIKEFAPEWQALFD